MPMLDLSVVLTDPYLLDKFDVCRTREIVNNFGESKKEITKIENVRGVVFPESLNDLARRPEAQLNTKTITVITRFALRGESNSSEDNNAYQPDRVFWRYNFFLVVRVEDYSHFASGFVKATATSTDMIDQATETKGATP